jgi:hypothetical protein
VQRTEQPFRCTCSREPVLGMYGIDENGRVYFHKIYRRKGEIYDQTYAQSDVSVWCRVCKRWWNLELNRGNTPSASEVTTPKPLTMKREESLCLPIFDDTM